MNRELPNAQVGFRKGRGTRDQIANIRWTIENARVFQKHSFPTRRSSDLKFMVHVLLKPGLENFEHYFTSVSDECNCAVV